ncbi:MAG: hypothetical protein ACLP1X_11590 [Polyangiaceae bacterium]|jgi:hypothetical protein
MKTSCMARWLALLAFSTVGCAAIDPEVGPSQESCGIDAASPSAATNNGYGPSPEPPASTQTCGPDAGSPCDDCESKYCCATRLACYSDPVCTCADNAMDICLAATNEGGAVLSPQAASCWSAFSAFGTVERTRVACERTWCTAACTVQ